MTPPAPAAMSAVQLDFAAHIRDPNNRPVPDGVSSRRMRVYVELFFSNIEQLLSNGFPVIRRLLDDEEWHTLVRDFMARHRCRTPLFPAIGRELSDFLSRHDAALAGRPFLAELARYEHLEVEAGLAPDADAGPRLHTDADLLDQVLQPAPSVRMAEFCFPVHRISPKFQPATAPDTPTRLLVYRDTGDQVRFMELTGFGYALLKLLSLQPGETARTALVSIAAALGASGGEEIIVSGHEFLQQLREREVLVARG